MNLKELLQKPNPTLLPPDDIIKNETSADSRFYGDHPAFPITNQISSSYFLLHKNSIFQKINGKNRFTLTTADSKLRQEDISILDTNKHVFKGYKIKEGMYFGVLKNLKEQKENFIGNFNAEGKLEGFGCVDDSYKGNFKNGWLNGYSHILISSSNNNSGDILPEKNEICL